MLRDLGQRLDRDVGDRARGHVVDDDRQRRCVGDGREMRGEPRLARLVVIRHDDQRGVGADVGGGADQLDRGGGRIAAAAGDHRHPALRDLARRARSPRDARRGSGSRSRRSSRTAPARSMPSAICHSTNSRECVFGDTAAGKWRHQRRNRAEKHELASSKGSLVWIVWAGVHGLIRRGTAKMSSMWRVAVIMPVLLATAPSSSAQYAAPASYAAAPAYAAPSVASSLDQWRTLRQSSGYRFADYAALPDRQSRLAGRDADARLGRKGDAAGRECRDRPRLLRADKPKTGNGWARLADAYAASGRMARGARRRAQRLGVGRPQRDRRAGDLGALWRQLHPRRPRRPRRCLAVRQEARRRGALPRADQPRAAGGVRRADRDAAERGRRRQPLPGGDRQRHQRRRADDGPRALPSRQQLSTRPRSSSPRAITISPTGPPIPSASTTC